MTRGFRRLPWCSRYQFIHSNHENIETVHARGFADAEDVAVRNAITAALAELEVPKSRPEPLEAW